MRNTVTSADNPCKMFCILQGVIAEAAVADSENAKQKAKMEAIPEFMRFNIVENEVRNVI